MNEGERRLLETVGRSSYIATFADPRREILSIEYYAYSVDQTHLTLDETAEQSFPLIMDSDSDFICTSLCGGAVISAPAIVAPANGNRVVEYSPALLIQILDQSSGKNYWNNATPLPMIAGTGGFPYLFVNPRIIRARTTLQISAKGISTDTTFSAFYFTLHGAKIYYAG